MTKRVVTGAMLIGVALLAVYYQGFVLLAGLITAMGLSTHEMFSALAQRGARPVRWPAYAFCAFCPVLTWLEERGTLSLGGDGILLAAAICSLLAMAVVVLRGQVDLEGMRASLFPILYPGIFFACIFRMALLEGRTASSLALAMTFFVPSMNDCFALFAGLWLGKHHLAPQISPKKTWEGAVGGLVASVAFGLLLPLIVGWVVQTLPGAAADSGSLPPLWQFALLGLFMGAAGQFGDLAASMVKRWCGIKDFSQIFPGHGGMMDRMDGILFGAPVCLLFFRLMGM